MVLIFDYVERTTRFIEILRQLDDLFDEPQNLRFVANCRHSFYEVSDNLGGVRSRLVEISDEEPWEHGYLEAVTSYILNTADIVEDENVRELCKGRPAFAVLLAYLKEREKIERSEGSKKSEYDLRALLNDKVGFADWFTGRLGGSFPGQDLRGEIATLMAFLPLSGHCVDLPEGRCHCARRRPRRTAASPSV